MYVLFKIFILYLQMRRLRQMALQEETSISQEEKEKYGCVMSVDYIFSKHCLRG